MTKKSAGLMMIALVFLFSSPAYSDFTCASHFIDIPTAYAMPHNSIKGIFAASFALQHLVPPLDPTSELDFGLNYGLNNKWEFGLNVYTYKDLALDIAYQIRPETERWPAVVVGVRDLTWKRHISGVGGGWDIHGLPNVWGYDKYYYTEQGLCPSENFSFYGVLSKNVFSNFKVHFGLGRGRFVGYGPNSSYMNSDIFWGQFGPKHDWAIGWFGALEYFQGDWFSVGMEQDGRDLNVGLKYRYEMFTFNVAITKIESWFWGYGHYTHRMAFGVGMQYPPPEQVAVATGIISGKVYDEATNAPLAAVLRVVGKRVPEVKTNPLTGAFEITNVPAGAIQLLVVCPGYGSRQFQLVLRPNTRYTASLPLRRAAGL